jgi:hypothetical protein
MNDRRSAPLAGIVSVVLFIVSIFVVESGSSPDSGASGSEMAEYLDGAIGQLAIALVLWGIGTVGLVWFLDGVRGQLARFDDRLGRLFYTFGVGAAILLLASFLPEVAGAFTSDEAGRALEPGAAEAMGALGDGFFVGGEMLLGGMFLFAALAIITTRALPAWLGWVSLVFAVVAFVPPIGWAVVVWGFPLWILAVAALFWRCGAAEGAPARAA